MEKDGCHFDQMEEETEVPVALREEGEMEEEEIQWDLEYEN